GEEFPLFRAFWIEKPAAGALELIVHALLDSPSATGAYRFVIQPGVSTVMDVEATLFARRTMSFFGLAPLTSMFIHGPAHRRLTGDFRPAVHDSEGLAIVNGRGERLWRPLTNPKKLQTSAFIDKDVKGFGLVQRDRRFANFEDLEARYERRPTAWVEPRGGWGEGVVELIEIPTEEEIHDNIVAYWRPAKPIEEQKSFAFVYRLHWADAPAAAWTGLRARKTRVGNGRKGAVLFVVDFDGPAGGSLKDLPAAELRASAGTVSKPVVQFNPEISGLRCSFELQPGAAELSELRLELWAGDQNVSEIWLYRWTRV
ncbi:MAG: glucan biosynthesis protein, partial [Hyphomicrobiaceae bacterium]